MPCQRASMSRRKTGVRFGSSPESPASFALDVGGPDHWPPLRDFGLGKGSERFRRLLSARGNVLANVGQPRSHGGIGERVHHGRIELVDHGSWQAFGTV